MFSVGEISNLKIRTKRISERGKLVEHMHCGYHSLVPFYNILTRFLGKVLNATILLRNRHLKPQPNAHANNKRAGHSV